MEIEKVDEGNFNEVIDFLKAVKLFEEINEEVVLNGEIIRDDEIIALICFEEFQDLALIRYFIFKKRVEDDLVKELFSRICTNVKAKNRNLIISLAIKPEAIEVLEKLGFYEVNSGDVYIDEVSLLDTKFRDATVFRYDL